MPNPLLRLRGLSYTYPSRRKDGPALRGVDLDVESGAFVTLVGPSGSGKSTLLHLLGMLETPTAGTYHFDGQDVGAMKRRARANLARGAVAFIFQAYHLLDDLTVAENVAEPLRYQGVPKGERRDRVDAVLARFDLAAQQGRFPTELSGGQQQLVGVARALAGRPRLLLADEPTGNLHSAHGTRVLDAIREMNETDGVTVLHVTHSERWASYGTRTLDMLDGQIVGDTAERVGEGSGA
jgi:ABC-type lipoprotein export system ATPase subunit